MNESRWWALKVYFILLVIVLVGLYLWFGSFAEAL